jgi:hypothetical protein
MTWESPSSASPPSCLVQVRQEPDGQITVQVLGADDLCATAATREEALEQLRTLLQVQVNTNALLAIELPRQNPLLRLAGHLKDDPDFDIYLEEIRKFREEMDRREDQDSGPGECSNTSATPTSIPGRLL